LFGAILRLTVAQLYNVAVNFCYLQRLPEAEPLLQRAFAIQAKILGEDHPETLHFGHL
jgi:hypothetical protein